MPLVCWCEAAQPGMVVELPLEHLLLPQVLLPQVLLPRMAYGLFGGPVRRPLSRDSTINLPRPHAIPDLADSVLGVLFMGSGGLRLSKRMTDLRGGGGTRQRR